MLSRSGVTRRQIHLLILGFCILAPIITLACFALALWATYHPLPFQGLGVRDLISEILLWIRAPQWSHARKVAIKLQKQIAYRQRRQEKSEESTDERLMPHLYNLQDSSRSGPRRTDTLPEEAPPWSPTLHAPIPIPLQRAPAVLMVSSTYPARHTQSQTTQYFQNNRGPNYRHRRIAEVSGGEGD